MTPAVRAVPGGEASPGSVHPAALRPRSWTWKWLIEVSQVLEDTPLSGGAGPSRLLRVFMWWFPCAVSVASNDVCPSEK